MQPVKYTCYLKPPYNKSAIKKINVGYGKVITFFSGVAHGVSKKELDLLNKLNVLKSHKENSKIFTKPPKKQMKIEAEKRLQRFFSGEDFKNSIIKNYTDFNPESIEPPELFISPESILDTKVIIIASGQGSRWTNHNNVPKHLARVFNNETLLERAVRLWTLAGAEDISIVTENENEGYIIPGSKVEKPNNSMTSSIGGTKKFLDSAHLWNKEGRTIVLYGDVFWTWNAIKTIVEYPEREWRLFARPDASRYTGTTWGECFAQSFYPEHQSDHMNKLLLVESLYDSGVMDRAGGWEHYRAMCGLKGKDIRTAKAKNHPEKMIIIDDLTDDIDNPQDYARLVAKTTYNTDKVTVIIPYSQWECPQRNRILSFILKKWETEYPNWKVVIGESEANPWRKAVSIKRALDKVTDGVVIIADADVWVPGIEHAVDALKGGYGWIKPHSLFVRLNEEATHKIIHLNYDMQQLASLQENLEEIPYQQTPCGGILVIHPEIARAVPPDPRFEGWGGEDVAWSYALSTLVGQNYMTDLVAYHLWHPPQERVDRKTPNEKNLKLQETYAKCKGSVEKMDLLVEEARGELGRYSF
jgi:hypothetical protein